MNLFGNFGQMGNPPTATPSLFSPSPAPVQNWSGDTVFSDLPQDIQKTLANFQTQLNNENNIIEELHQRSTEPITRVSEQISLLREKLTTLLNTLDADLQSVHSFKREVNSDLKNAEMAGRMFERLKAPVVMNSQMNFSPPSPFFLQLAQTFENRMREYSQHIEEIQRYLLYSNGRTYTPKMLQDIMRNQYELFLSLAAQVAVLHEQMAELREAYLNFRKKYFSDTHNPFKEAEMRRKRRSFLTREIPNKPQIAANPSTAPTQPALGSSTTPALTSGLFSSTPSLGSSFGAGSTPSLGSSFGAGSTPSPFSSSTTAPGSLFTPSTSATTSSSLFGPSSTAPALSFGGTPGTTGSSGFSVTNSTGFGSTPSSSFNPSGASTAPSVFGGSSLGGTTLGGTTFGSTAPTATGTFGENPNSKKNKNRSGSTGSRKSGSSVR